MKKVVTFKFERETKNTLRFNEVDAAGNVVEQGFSIGALYVQKAIMPKVPTNGHLTVTLDWPSAE